MTLNPLTKDSREMFYNQVMRICKQSLRNGLSVKELIFVLNLVKRKLSEGGEIDGK